ncbi:hypothetical protein ACWCP6_15720 [Streptomyces sp. NPDC002004]
MATSDDRSAPRSTGRTRRTVLPAAVSAPVAVTLIAGGIAAGAVACTSTSNTGSAQSAASSAAAYASRVAASVAAQASGMPSPGETRVFADASELQSAAASLATSHPSSVAIASSLQARASEFEASVSAQLERSRASAENRLKSVSGTGNAAGDVSVRGLPNATPPSTRAALVTITNRTQGPASYAVQVDFTDKSGKTVDTAFVTATDVAPGKPTVVLAFSHHTDTSPKLAKAERY